MTFKLPLSMGALLSSMVLAGCSHVPLDNGGAPVESRNVGANANAGGAGASGSGASKVTPVDLSSGGGDVGGSLAQRTIYFDFDSYAVKSDYQPIIDRFAKSLAADPKKHVQVAGHTDDRGGSEYNLALGQKRAEAVTKSLALLGASSAQVEAVSFGKERPAVQGSDEAAYAKNRRAELSYR